MALGSLCCGAGSEACWVYRKVEGCRRYLAPTPEPAISMPAAGTQTAPSAHLIDRHRVLDERNRVDQGPCISLPAVPQAPIRWLRACAQVHMAVSAITGRGRRGGVDTA